MTARRCQIKKALRKSHFAGSFNLSKYSTTPYAACAHACKYCEGRAEKYHVDGDFETNITIRENLPQVLAVELTKIKEDGVISFASGITDSYQPLERDERIMQKCAALVAERGMAATVMSKSALIRRDLSLWRDVNVRRGFVLCLSLTFADDRLRRIFEPGASAVSERLQTLSDFKKEGMAVGVTAMPLIPYISDTDENLLPLLERLSDIGIDFIIPGGLTLRPGRQKEVFLDTIKNHFGRYSRSINDLYRPERASGAAIPSYREASYRRIWNLIREYGISPLIPHRVYRGLMPFYDELHILLNHMVELYSMRGISTAALRYALNRYTNWVRSERETVARRKDFTSQLLQELLLPQIVSKRFPTIIGNDKLGNFIRRIIIDHEIYDYHRMKIGV